MTPLHLKPLFGLLAASLLALSLGAVLSPNPASAVAVGAAPSLPLSDGHAQAQHAFLSPPQAEDSSSHTSKRPGRIFLIRHAEKRKGGSNGLAEKGKVRAQCLKHFFGHGEHKVDYIIAQAYKPDGRRSRPYQTVKPLADHLGLKVDLHCEREEADCVAKRALQAVAKGQNVLVCWQHKALTDIARAFGVRGLRYPPARSDILFQLSHKGKVSAIRSEECSGLDDDFRGWHGSKKMSPKDKLIDDEAWAPGAGEHHHTASYEEEDDGARAEGDHEAESLLAAYELDELSEIFAPVHDQDD
ncbi:unnamed protein product [Tilletia controversa]|uniref:Phosphoglycerate mutase family protein n=2 Tax=Tilletia TaxID=13289 RepID=A0A177U1K0_9BASI|nr:hypothetical protein CF336_g7713 [Tilletia laevis]KAE8247988.1 hypothetical protein A4X03_0g6902 [Tilletia caries]CAD6899578.1 unnamed protein product [Tilletia controversa]KAE8188056.1 hypothetical protein CF335_g6994 [Tilletia laevis]CAD6892673.1 unnamed protein product [Tilletia caries]